MPSDRVRVFVVRRGVRHIASGIIGHNRYVITYLLILWKAGLRIERVAHCNVRRPRHTAIGTPGVEYLGVDVVGRISRVIPHRIDPSIRCDRKCAQPVPFALMIGVVVYSDGRAEGCAAIGAARKHHFREVLAGREYARKHVNVVIGRAA